MRILNCSAGFLKLWKNELDKSNITIFDSKTKLQEYSLKNFKKLPVYQLVNIKGPRHKPVFKVNVSIKGSKKFFGEEIESVPRNTFEDALKNTENDNSNFSILPVENSIEGTVGQSIDAITQTDLHSIGEIYLKVEHCLIGIGKLEEIKNVY